MSPRCVIVAGPNGAGKSTLAPDLVRETHGITRYVNADTIAAGLAGFAPAIADRRAGRIALETIAAYILEGVDFSFETTLSGRRWPRLLDTLEEAGYTTLLHYLWLPTADLAVARVRYRVERGGHAVPEADVRRRYESSLRNLIDVWIPRVDAWQVFDASRLSDQRRIAVGELGSVATITDYTAWRQITLGG
jgi:predicted ABC-type ATPase